MESQHSTKINKYLALRTTIESNGWFVELSAVEVGARGYRSKSVLCCLKKLGFNNSKIKEKIAIFKTTAISKVVFQSFIATIPKHIINEL